MSIEIYQQKMIKLLHVSKLSGYGKFPSARCIRHSQKLLTCRTVIGVVESPSWDEDFKKQDNPNI